MDKTKKIIVEATLKDGVSKGLKDMGGSMEKLESKLKVVGDKMQTLGKNMTQYVTLPILALGGGMVKSAMDFEATEAKYKTVFSGMTDRADEFIAKFKELTPATTAEARSMAAGIQDLLVPLGFARDEATTMTGEFMHVAGALANFNSGTHTTKQVTDAMTRAVLGETEMLKGLGIQLDVETIKRKAYEMGLAKEGEELTRQMKAQVVLAEVYRQSGDALTAYTEENLDTITKSKLLKAEIIDTAVSFGDFFLPTINRVVDVVKEFTEKIKALSPEQKEMILKIMGIVAALGPVIFLIGKALIVLPKLAAGFTLISGPIGWIIALLVGLATGLAYLWKNNEEFRNKVIAAWSEIGNKFQEFMESEFVQNAKTILGNIWDAIVVGAEAFGETFSVMWGIIQSVYEDNLKPAFEELGEVFKKIFGEGADESVGFADILKTVATVIAYAIGGIIIAFIWIVTAVVKVMTWFGKLRENSTEVFTTVWESIKEAFNKVKSKFEEIAEAVRVFWDEKVNPILESLKEGFAKVGEFFNWVWINVLEPVFLLMAAVFGWATRRIQEAWEKVKENFSIVWEWIKKHVLEPIGAWLNDKIVTPFNTVYEKVEEKMDNLKTKLSEIWDGIKKFFNDKVDDIKDPLVKPFEDAEKTIAGIVGSIKELISGLDIKTKAEDIGSKIKGWANEINKRQSGGNIMRSGFYDVGEAGPERIYLPQGSRVKNASDTSRERSNSGTVNITNNFSQTDMDVDSLAQKLSFQLKIL
jgi:phage-related protein